MKHTLKTSFILKKSKANSKGKAPIILRITVNGIQANVSTGIYIEPELWSTAKAQIIGKSELATSYNKKLLMLVSQVYEAEAHLIAAKSPLSAEIVKNKLKGVEEESKTLLQVFDYKLKQMSALVGKDFEQSTYDKFSYIRNHTAEFIMFHYKRKDIYLTEIRYNFITEFEYFLKTEKNQAQVTLNKCIQRLRQIINYAISNDWLLKDPFLTYRAKHVAKQIEYLNNEELKKLENYTFSQERLELIKDLFIFSCYTGLAYYELSTLAQENIIMDMEGDKWICSQRKKTDKQFKVPLLPIAEGILKKYANHPLKINKGTLLPIISNQKVNSYLKEIAEIIGIKINLTHHIARKTFASTVLLSNGISMDTVKELLGHSSVTITEKHYGKVVQAKVKADMTLLKEKLTSTDKTTHLFNPKAIAV